MSAINFLPVPYFELNESNHIMGRSNKARLSFKHVDCFLDLLDVGSVDKAERFFAKKVNGTIELNMNTVEAPYVLYTVHVNWQGEFLHMVCIKQEGNLTKLIEKVQMQSRRLAETDFELVEKKEELEQSLHMIKRLSAPFIAISTELAFVPFFGDLDGALIAQNQAIISKNVFKANYDYLFFDFSGVGNITENGLRELLHLVQSLQIMGIETRVIGLKPEHARLVQGNDIQKRTQFNGSLAEMIKRHMG